MKGGKHYGKSKGSGGKKAGHGAGMGWGATGPGGTSKSRPTSKGPYTPGNKGAK
ncbi:MAG: hypothetical protein ACR2RF_24990 [Geminicoccaceae bacterium]